MVGDPVRAFDAADYAGKLVRWIQERVSEARASGVVFGLSGGIDSAVVGALCHKAFPRDSLALILPCQSLGEDIEDARMVAAHFGLTAVEVNLDRGYEALKGELEAKMEGLPADLARRIPGPGQPSRVKAQANLKPRLRMVALYFFANMLNYLVVGTGNKSEITVGYFTKYGDGGVDILPLGNLVKREVRELARYLGVPGKIIEKPPTAGLWRGQTDEGEMGLTYEELDGFITTNEARSEVREKILKMASASRHKRELPPIPLF